MYKLIANLLFENIFCSIIVLLLVEKTAILLFSKILLYRYVSLKEFSIHNAVSKLLKLLLLNIKEFEEFLILKAVWLLSEDINSKLEIVNVAVEVPVILKQELFLKVIIGFVFVRLLKFAPKYYIS